MALLKIFLSEYSVKDIFGAIAHPGLVAGLLTGRAERFRRDLSADKVREPISRVAVAAATGRAGRGFVQHF